MIKYDPGVYDRSGEIIAAGQLGAAQTNADMMKGLGEDIGGAIASLAGSYVQGKQLKAKADGYSEFLGMHGEQLGFKPEYLEQFKKKSPAEQIALGDMLINSYLPHAQRMQYLNTQMGGRGAGVGYGGGGGGGGAGGTRPAVGEVFTF
jgi:hypothetical protein